MDASPIFPSPQCIAPLSITRNQFPSPLRHKMLNSILSDCCGSPLHLTVQVCHRNLHGLLLRIFTLTHGTGESISCVCSIGGGIGSIVWKQYKIVSDNEGIVERFDCRSPRA